MPISSRTSFDNTGASYDVSRILNPDSTINLEKYHSYSPLFLSTTFAISVSKVYIARIVFLSKLS